jgi:hypothetical protein
MRASRAVTIVAFLATYPFWSTPSYPQNAGIGIGIGSSSSNAISGQGGQGGAGGNGNANSNLTIQTQPGEQTITSTGRLRTDGSLDETITQRGGTANSLRQTGTQRIISAPSTFAPGLTAAGVETCLGSVSGGASFPGGGVSFGTTTKDTGCDARLDARTLWSMNLKRAAIFRLCQKPEIAAAMPDVCPQPQQATAPQLASSVGPALVPADPPGRGQRTLVIFRGQERYCDDFDGRRCHRWSR